VKGAEILTMPASMGVCRNCGTSDIDRDYFVEFRIVRQGNTGQIVCDRCGHVAWDVAAKRPFDNIPGEQLDQLERALKAFYAQ
jgi:hypothetical protein